MKTNLTKLISGTEFTYGIFIGVAESEIFTGTDFYPNFMDFYFGIDGLYYVHDYEGLRKINMTQEIFDTIMLTNKDTKSGKKNRKNKRNFRIRTMTGYQQDQFDLIFGRNRKLRRRMWPSQDDIEIGEDMHGLPF